MHERKILWPDGAQLSIQETARRIHRDSGEPLDMVESHVVGWLQMTYEPTGLDESQMEEFENLIELWTAPYEDIPLSVRRQIEAWQWQPEREKRGKERSTPRRA